MKSFIKSGIIRGALFAVGMAAFEYFSDGVFNPYKFLFHFVFFGVSMTAIDYYKAKKEEKSKK